ncbi:MAG: hypothetical protein H8E01_00340, partial [Chloroflexi bacterium]|nr:hypothetical protein [Chloroflexota bacterium]
SQNWCFQAVSKTPFFRYIYCRGYAPRKGASVGEITHNSQEINHRSSLVNKLRPAMELEMNLILEKEEI